jgi:hypothetical protein
MKELLSVPYIVPFLIGAAIELIVIVGLFIFSIRLDIGPCGVGKPGGV